MSKFFDAANEAAPSVIEMVKGPVPAASGETGNSGSLPPDEAAAGGAVSAFEGLAATGQPDSLSATAMDLPGLRRAGPLFTGGRTVSIRLAANEPLLPFDGSHETAAERYRIIRTRILQHPRQPRMICISSSGSGDGKTVNAINTAGALSLKQDSCVLLVDCDLRRSSLHERLGIPRSPGLSDVLAERVDWAATVLRIAEAPNLHIIPAGEPAIAPPELLESPRWVATCAELRAAFDYVVVDSPPIGIVADFDLIQAVCDSVMLIVRQDHTERGALLKAIESIPKEKMLGVVMNSQEGWLAKRSSSSYGGYGYGYGGKKDPKKEQKKEKDAR